MISFAILCLRFLAPISNDELEEYPRITSSIKLSVMIYMKIEIEKTVKFSHILQVVIIFTLLLYTRQPL